MANISSTLASSASCCGCCHSRFQCRAPAEAVRRTRTSPQSLREVLGQSRGLCRGQVPVLQDRSQGLCATTACRELPRHQTRRLRLSNLCCLEQSPCRRHGRNGVLNRSPSPLLPRASISDTVPPQRPGTGTCSRQAPLARKHAIRSPVIVNIAKCSSQQSC